MSVLIENKFVSGKTRRFTHVTKLHQAYQTVKHDTRHLRDKWKGYYNEYNMRPTRLPNGKLDPNHGKFRRAIDARVDVYVDIATERGRWASIKTYHGDSKEMRAKWSRIITDAFHEYCIMLWQDRNHDTYLDVFDMVMHGHGHEFFDRYFGCYPCHIPAVNVFPNTSAGQRSKDWDLVFIEQAFTGTELYEKIQDEDILKAEGWNKPAVLDLLRSETATADEENDFEQDFTGDNVSTDALNCEYKLVYAYVKEYGDNDGNKISRFIFPETLKATSGSEERRSLEFLSEKEYFEESMDLVICPRTDVISKKYYKSASWADLNYFLGVFYNRSMNKVVRSVLRNLHLFLKSSNPDQEEKLSRLDPNAEVSVLDQDTQIVQQAVNVNWTGLLEIIRQVEFDTRSELKDRLSTGSQNVKGRAITAREAEINLSQSESAISTDHKVFNTCDTDLIRAIYKRFVDNDRMAQEDHLGYPLFLKEMENKGVPPEAYDPSNVIVESVLNFGSTNRREKYANAVTLMQALKAWSVAQTEGEKRAAQDMVASIVGRSNLHYYLPEQEESRLQLTEMFRIGGENVDLNSHLTNPRNVVVNPEQDNHILHASGHIQDALMMLENAQVMVEQAAQSPLPVKSPRLMETGNLIVAQQNKIAHATAHIQIISQADEDQGKQFDDLLANVRQAHVKVARLFQQEFEKLLKETQQNAMFTQEEMHRIRMNELEYQKAQQDMGLKAQQQVVKGELNRAGAEANQEQKLRHKEESHGQEMALETLKTINEIVTKRLNDTNPENQSGTGEESGQATENS